MPQQQPTPMIAPPSSTPPIPAVQTGSNGIRRCLNRTTYIWLNNGTSFWFIPTFVGKNTMIGFRWRGFGWVYDKINMQRIRSFQCF
jgi:hypothetical protein